MGLDSVELVVAFEEHFEIAIPDEIAENLITLGHVYYYVLSKKRVAKVPEKAKNVIWE